MQYCAAHYVCECVCVCVCITLANRGAKYVVPWRGVVPGNRTIVLYTHAYGGPEKRDKKKYTSTHAHRNERRYTRTAHKV